MPSSKAASAHRRNNNAESESDDQDDIDYKDAPGFDRVDIGEGIKIRSGGNPRSLDESDDEDDRSGSCKDAGDSGYHKHHKDVNHGESDWEVDKPSVDREEKARAAARLNALKRNASTSKDQGKDDGDWVQSKYNPDDRFMINITKEENVDLGIEIVEFKVGKGKFSRNELYVTKVDQGPFRKTAALDRGDKILSVNAKKVPDKIKSAEDAMDLLRSKAKIAMLILRPSRSDKGYKWVMENT
ncbi:unnamed protein product [Pseudo-nitzschia multistriata]|uniref:PDZ domain-containing protein n=1 Tax=Pseudo-nitzschia multistriata TaxID=183589 RepID=A0A448ZG99_9STRA|nr:unnamed protein product [Pseudo-nitzschia multistriata]